MTVATLGYQDIRSAVLQLPPRQRLQLIKETILTLTVDTPVDEQETVAGFDFKQTLVELQNAFARAHPLTDQVIDDAHLAYLLEKHSA